MAGDETQTMVTEREIVRFVAADGGVWWDSDGVEGRCDFCGAEMWDDGTQDEEPFPHREDCRTMQARALLKALGDNWMGAARLAPPSARMAPGSGWGWWARGDDDMASDETERQCVACGGFIAPGEGYGPSGNECYWCDQERQEADDGE